MKKILAYVTSDANPSLFDLVVAYDCEVDVVVPYTGMREDGIEEVIHNCVFTRRVEHLSNTAVFIGGKDAAAGELMFDGAKSVLAGLPDEFNVSVALDPEGASTTSSACVSRIKGVFPDGLSGVNAAVLAGTGPVGQRVSALLSRQGAKVKLTSRKLSRAEQACKRVKERYGGPVEPHQVLNEKDLAEALSDAEVVVSCGSEGVEILPEPLWRKLDSVKVLADVNAVPPYGIGGIKANDNLKEREGKMFLGAIAIGNTKMRLHQKLVEELFKSKDGLLDLTEIYGMLG